MVAIYRTIDLKNIVILWINCFSNYVYHKLEKLVTNDYVLVYFHGATPKHRMPDLKFLKKCYQMINLRLRKNLRSVYVVHPTRWLRTVIALSRPFFSNKFYHKVHYVYTIAELEQQLPNNHLEIPNMVEQMNWLFSQRYDRPGSVSHPHHHEKQPEPTTSIVAKDSSLNESTV
ncbi:unnamed protein product [Didymodactylos carnosus]|uniref:CRAL-TRIO domain-containing protein n=1 Tax=Didymodactylos carnosus TaxID=1234261 RepID=A0A814Q102_9BILA|nr:unnamed protein product [Didymodactylos carnosus]CAF1112969.1 unnamed protein product [Didymodactylos carnosus]CAF3589424.1 unnamed protein product [Didymodactylos carnosus]CAF3877135.1 unnamed protein product [Didymodactylos carnosus]